MGMKKSDTRGLIAAIPSDFLVENEWIRCFFCLLYLGDSTSDVDPLSDAERVISSELVLCNLRNPIESIKS